MTPRRSGGIILLAAACALGSYFATYAFQQQGNAPLRRNASPDTTQNLSNWLQLSPQQADAVRDIEATFAAEIKPLEAKLQTEREKLAAMFEDVNTADADILQQVENVIAAHDAVERRVAAHLIAMRPHLSPEQQKRIFDRFASTVREGGGWKWRHGQAGRAEGERRGGGPPPNRGHRGGRGGGGGRGN